MDQSFDSSVCVKRPVECLTTVITSVDNPSAENSRKIPVENDIFYRKISELDSELRK